MTGKRRRCGGLPVMGWHAVPEFRVNRLAAFSWGTVQGYQPLTTMSDRLQMTSKDGLNTALSIHGVKIIDRKARSRPPKEEGTV
jgi:hypothetical protein